MSTTTSSPVEMGDAPLEQVPATTAEEDSLVSKYWVNGFYKYEVEDVEDVEMYKPGGLDPVYLEEFIGEYEVVHKLGHGPNATVWLCRDHEQNRWCALKIVAASHSSEDKGELLLAKVLGDDGVNSAAAHHIMLPDKHFWHQGPNVRHLVLVLPLLGPSLRKWLEHNQHKLEAKKKLCRQMTKAIGFLQSQGVCHGDFMIQNVLMEIRNLDHLTEDEILAVFDDGINIAGIQTPSGGDPPPNAPSYAVVPAMWPTYEDEDNIILEDIVVAGFGEAFVPDGKDSHGVARAFSAPEVTFLSAPGLPSDIWSLGAAIMDVLGTMPFSGNHALFWESSIPDRVTRGRYRYKQSRWQDYILMEMVKPDDKPELGVFSLTDSQRNDPAHPAAYESVAALEEARNKAIQRGGYTHPISAALERRDDEEVSEKDLHDETVLLTDLALKIFRYEPTERIRTADI
ncbi:CMGC/SRPK protein kinase [Apiospora aurea]|uniref:non-specific serine/threonine protein kinase n=1 Tax=Apiospora aurea TaxID=335848 RepID=A0ABR1QGZ9_9PEZI